MGPKDPSCGACLSFPSGDCGQHEIGPKKFPGPLPQPATVSVPSNPPGVAITPGIVAGTFPAYDIDGIPWSGASVGRGTWKAEIASRVCPYCNRKPDPVYSLIRLGSHGLEKRLLCSPVMINGAYCKGSLNGF